MKLILPLLGKTKQAYLDEGIRDYSKRLSHFMQVDLPVLKGKNSRSLPDEQLKRHEAELLLDAISSCRQGVVVALDPQGKMVDSPGLASLLDQWQMQGVDSAAFLIGGHLGLHPSIVERADQLLSLSRLTFTHEMTRLITLEQLYRACTILAGQKYHK